MAFIALDKTVCAVKVGKQTIEGHFLGLLSNLHPTEQDTLNNKLIENAM
jgi:hypothetical protein